MLYILVKKIRENNYRIIFTENIEQEYNRDIVYFSKLLPEKRAILLRRIRGASDGVWTTSVNSYDVSNIDYFKLLMLIIKIRGVVNSLSRTRYCTVLSQPCAVSLEEEHDETLSKINDIKIMVILLLYIVVIYIIYDFLTNYNCYGMTYENYYSFNITK